MENVINTYTLLFAILTAFAVAAYLIHIWRRKELKNTIPLAVTSMVIALLYIFIAAPGLANYYNGLVLDICIALISTILAICYISKPYVFLSLIILLLAGILVYVNNYPGSTLFMGMFAIGTISGLLYRDFALSSKKDARARKRKSTEIKRDIIQIFMGIILVAVILLSSRLSAISIIFALVLLGYLTNNLLANFILSPLYKRAADLERKNVSYGLGATYLAAGTSLVLGFTSTTPLLLFGIVALFFGDSMATIIGISARRAAHLPHNRYKTIVGSLAFFFTVAVIGYFIIGLYAVPLAAVLAFVESLDIFLDDNIRTGIVVVILGAALGL